MPSPGQGDICCVQRTARRLVGLDRVERARAEMGGGTDRQPADSPQIASMVETAPGSVRVQDGQSDVSLWKFRSECSTENRLCGGRGRGGSYPGGNGDLMKTGWGRRQA